MLENALSFALQHTKITELRTIKHCRKSLYDKNEFWKKKNTDNCFDVTMRRYDVAEICELEKFANLYFFSPVKIHRQNQLRFISRWRSIFFGKIPMNKKWIISEN